MRLGRTPLFIIGSPRSGTTWLQIMLSAHPSVCTTVELTLYSRYTAPWIEAWREEAASIAQGRWIQGLPFLWTENDLYQFLREFAARVYQRALETEPQATHILDKHPGYSKHVDAIQRIWPEARFIHMIRDGRDVAVSMVAARQRIGFGTKTIEDSARAWKKHVLEAREARQYKARYLEVKYEDLLREGTKTLRSVFEFCNVSVTSHQVARILYDHRFERMKAKRQGAAEGVKTNKAHYRKGQAGTWRKEMSAMERYIFHRVAGDLLCELGYAGDNWWRTHPAGQVFLPALTTATLVARAAQRRILRAICELLGPELIARIRADHRDLGVSGIQDRDQE